MTLSHLDDAGGIRMVDVGGKPATERTATATAVVRCSADAAARIRDASLHKGDLLTTARVAGIMAAKRTPELIPLCHSLPLSHVEVGVEVDESLPGVRISATARCTAQTGVEMEALTAVAIAGLTVIDMAKSVDPWMTLDGIALQRKQGGRHGTRERPAAQ